MLKKYGYSRQAIDASDIKKVSKVLKGDWLTCGPFVSEFEKELARYVGCKYAVAVSNGTTALHLACLALDVKKGDLGLTSPITFLASANCVEYCGGSVDFIDIDPGSLCLSAAKLEEYCKKKRPPKVVIPVDFAGIPAPLPEIWNLRNKYGFKIIEDAAHSLGTTYTHNSKTHHCGDCSFSDLAIFSFHPVKNITTGEGGAVTTNSKKLADRLRQLRNHGMSKKNAKHCRWDGPWCYQMAEMGFNFRITDLQCALGTAQLNKIERFKRGRQRTVAQYNKAFANDSRLITPPWPENVSPCQHLYPLQLAKGPRERKRTYIALKNRNIFPQIHYIPVYWQPYYARKYGYRKGKCPESETYYSRCLSMPLFFGLKRADILKIVEAFKDILH